MNKEIDIIPLFAKPTIEEVKEYCLSRKNSVDPSRFWNFYEAKGWKIGKNPMKNWRAAVNTWEGSNQTTIEPIKKIRYE